MWTYMIKTALAILAAGLVGGCRLLTVG